MLIKFCRKLIILASFLFVLGFAQTQVSANDSSNSNSSVISDDTTKAIDDASKQAEQAVEEVTNDAEKKSGDTSSTSDYAETEIKLNLTQHNMNWVNSHILQNYKFYHQDSSLTDFSSGAAHIMTDLFTAVNLNIVYPLFDKSLSTMFDLTNITDGINKVLGSVGKYSQKAWQSDAMKSLLYLAFGAGLVWTFAKSIKSGGGLKSILTILVVAVVGSAWVSGGSTVLRTINTLTSNAQTAVFVATSDIDDSGYTSTGDDFQGALRYAYFTKAVERPFLLGNYSVATMADAEKGNDKMGNPYRLIGGNVTDDVLTEFAKNNSYIKKKGGQEWYQVAIAFMSPVMSVAYGIPLLMVGLANLLVQLGAILLYYLAPFTIMISLLPKFANSALKTAMGALGLLFAKVGLLFGIMFISWVGNVTDIVIPPTNSASSMLNSIVYIVLMILLWKNKSWLVQTIIGSSVANNAMNKISMTRAGRKALGTANEMRNSANRMYQGARNGIKRGRDMKDNYKDKHSDEFDDDELRDEIEQEEQAKRKQARKDYLSKDMAKHQAQVKKDRASRLKNAMPNQDIPHDTPQSKDNDLPDNNGTHSRAIADEVKLPRYQRSKELKKVPETSDSATELTGRKPSKSYETGSKEAQKRREARSKVLKSKDDTIHFNQRLQADNEQRKQNKQDLDKELR
ncbi:MAG: CD3337/EF1877 family mobilome membrane protein [Leuconostoc mesenteroides]